MITSNIRKLAEELGFDQLSESMQTDITDRLNRAEKIDDVETVTFGLETDDGKIVKVFVNEKDVEKFEKLMADCLGSTDSIEDAINKAATEVDIVDVEWPEDNEEDEEDVIDGSEVLDPKVYKKANLDKEIEAGLKPKYDDTTERTNVTESSSGHLGDRLVTANQQLVYQAIIDLGVPEDALSRSSYRASILLGIKETAKLLAKSPTLKVAIKQVVKNRINLDSKHDKSGKHKEDEDVKEGLLSESATTELYWSVFDAFVKQLDDTQDQKVATEFLKLPKMMTLHTRSAQLLTRKITAQVKTRLQALSMSFDDQAARSKAPSQPALEESLSSAEVAAGVMKLMSFAEPKNLPVVDAILDSSQGKRMMAMIQRRASMLPSTIKTRLEGLLDALSAVPVTEAQDGYQLGDFSFTEEQAEIALKAITNKITSKLVTTDGKNVILSPRARKSFVKLVGSTEHSDITAEQIETMKAALT